VKIGVIGSGLMGAALGTVWAAAGHEVIFSYSRDFNKLQTLAQQAEGTARAGSPAEAAAQDVVLIAVPWKQVDAALAEAGSLAGKTLISCMLPMTDDDSALALGFSTSGAEELANRTGAKVVGTFNTVWSNVIAETRDSDAPRPSMFYVGDDTGAKQTAAVLIRDAGFEPVDAGELQTARLLEPFGLMMGQLGFAYNPLVAYRFLNSGGEANG
jgi:8-hydroxy-5-deazaflavin:NADPH oxidoreductase